METILTLPMIGWTPVGRAIACGFSINKYGEQEANDPYQPDCGNRFKPDGDPITGNDPRDTSLPVDASFTQAWLRHLTRTFGLAEAGGVRFYILDNEPMLWHETHRDVHPDPVSYDEIRDRTYEYAAALKASDPGALTLGPGEWGWTAYFYSALDEESGNLLNPHPDQKAHDGLDFILIHVFTIDHQPHPDSPPVGFDQRVAQAPQVQAQHARSTLRRAAPIASARCWSGPPRRLSEARPSGSVK